MKRGRDGERFGGQARRPPSHPLQHPGVNRVGNVFPDGPPQPTRFSQRLTTNDALSYLRDVKDKFKDHKDTYDTFLEIMKRFKANRINTEGVIEQVKSLFKGHRELILGFNTFLPKGFEITLPEDPPDQPKAAVEFDQAINYVNKIKNRFSHDERVYKGFLEILNMYRKGTKSIADVYQEVSHLFQSHNDLLEEFTYFLPESGPLAAQQNQAARRGAPNNRGRGRDADLHRGTRGGKTLDLSKELIYFNKVKERLRTKESYNEFMKAIALYGKDIISRQEMVAMAHELLSKNLDLAHQFESTLNRLEVAEVDYESMKGRPPARDTRRGQAEKFGMRPISDMDVSGWERAMTSYVKLPKTYPKLKATHMTATGRHVLQDDWVSVTSGSEDYSFKHMRKNQYEEALFRCEDDRFELDMAIEGCRSAFNAFKNTREHIQTLTPEERENFRLTKEFVSPNNLRMVQKIYGTLPGEKGQEMVEILKKNPVVVVDVVEGRLLQKLQEWEKDKNKMTEVWQKMYDANYHKSLDHRSFYFKQTDKRILGQKVMLQEIKDLAEKNRSEDDTIAMAFPNGSLRLSPDLTYNHKASIVHEDVRRIIKYSIDEMLSSELSEKAKNMWTTVIEPLFGLTMKPFTESPKAEVPNPLKTDLETRIREEGDASGDNRDGSCGPSATENPENPETTGQNNLDGPTALLNVIGKISNENINERASSEEQGDASDVEMREPTPKMDAEGHEDESSSEAFENCKPVCPTLPPHASKIQDSASCSPSGRVLYGNEPFYTLFRLHQHLYDRLRTARRCALLVADAAFRQMSEAQLDERIGSLPQPAEKIHNDFMSLVFQLIDNRLDSSSYEDLCRSLLGTSSYTVFTLDKLVYKIVKQIQQVLSDVTCVKLLELYRYEKSRRAPVVELVYHQNVHVILHEDIAFRFESKDTGDFCIQLLDQDRSEVKNGALPPNFESELQSFLYKPIPSVKSQDSAIKWPYLARNLPTISLDNLEERQIQFLKGTTMTNGLESKLITKTSKVSYCLDTEDYFRRPKSGPKNLDHAQILERRKRFNAWINNALTVNLRAQQIPMETNQNLAQHMT